LGQQVRSKNEKTFHEFAELASTIRRAAKAWLIMALTLLKDGSQAEVQKHGGEFAPQAWPQTNPAQPL
jgi:hypothetical protein